MAMRIVSQLARHHRHVRFGLGSVIEGEWLLAAQMAHGTNAASQCLFDQVHRGGMSAILWAHVDDLSIQHLDAGIDGEAADIDNTMAFSS
jgi:hypothetical protein